jgi:hypothetical protein
MEALKEKFAVEQMPLAPINPNENPNQWATPELPGQNPWAWAWQSQVNQAIGWVEQGI